ncbi:hypothetical protein O181_017057 [Austropuccinia psidii MF-1]|uniref:Uncharacterized protein n=1 Tax=Austropuccinia psidii MF-1 TaxID=1389203 RepID=A0A9Q3GS87_9BASI|nr:hypothetical protein [Austropuccinia psidii MF-1]
MTKLTLTNWVQWSCQFENSLISEGMENLLDPPSKDVKKTSKFKKRNGGALTLLWSSIRTEFEGVLPLLEPLSRNFTSKLSPALNEALKLFFQPVHLPFLLLHPIHLLLGLP